MDVSSPSVDETRVSKQMYLACARIVDRCKSAYSYRLRQTVRQFLVLWTLVDGTFKSAGATYQVIY